MLSSDNSVADYCEIAAHSAYDMFSKYKYLFFSHLGFWSGNCLPVPFSNQRRYNEVAICQPAKDPNGRTVFIHSHQLHSILISAPFYIVVYVYMARYLSHLVGKPTMWFPNRSNTNRAVLAQKQARSLKFWS